MKHTAPTTTLESRTLWHNIVSTIIILAIATILAFSFFHITQSDPANIALIYILALIIIARITTGYFFGIISAFFCVIFINWCFTYPYFKVSFAISGYPVTFVFLLTISMIVSTLTTRLKKQDKIITNVAHDLRTPLTSIIGSSDSFTENYAALSDQEKLDLVSSINEDSHWLLNMVENLLSITRIQGDTGRVRKEDELVEEVVSEAITRIKKRIPDIEIHVTAPDNILIIPMDPLLIEQVLMNLIENAFVHSETNRPVELQISEESDTLTFHVIDYGKGIDEQTIPLILKGEYHVPKTSDTHRGMGIGLSICNTIVQAHGGQISAHNHAHGAEFLFTLPKGDI